MANLGYELLQTVIYKQSNRRSVTAARAKASQARIMCTNPLLRYGILPIHLEATLM